LYKKIYFAGGGSVLLLRVVLKSIFTILVEFLYRLIGLPSFNSSKYRKEMPPNPKHYTKQFKLPPIYVSTLHLCKCSTICAT